MEVNHKVLQIFNYLHSIKTINDKKVRNISDYEEVFFQNELCTLEGITLINSEDNDNWIEITKESKDVYNKFSKLFLNLEKNSENLEVIYGHGLFVGKLSDTTVVHPILTTKMDLTFNEKKSIFTLKPYNNVTNVELDMLSELQGEIKAQGIESDKSSQSINSFDFSLENLLNTASRIKSLGVNPRDEEEVERAIVEITSALKLNANINYDVVQSLLDLEGEGGINIYNEPVIIFRKVDTRLWNMELTSMIEEIKKGFKIPKTIEALITDQTLSLSEEERESWREIGEELLFPLPYNEEQKEITKRLSENFGVVVQGPPGTGKSHTIVNLISHLLAHGKRVLVTSQTDRALKVLNNKIPQEIKSLCMSILGDDSKAMEDLDEGVRKITENLSLDTGELKKEYKLLKYKLRQCEESQQKLLNNLKEVYTLENSIVNYLGNNYYVADMAKFLKENCNTLSYIEDEITLDMKEFLSNEEFDTLISLHSVHSKELIELYYKAKENIDKLPELSELILNIEGYKTLLQSIYVHRGNVSDWYDKENTSYTNSNLINTIETANEVLKKYEDTVMEGILDSIYENGSKKNFWNEFIINIKRDLEKIYNLRATINKYKIVLPENVDIIKLKKDFEVIHSILVSKGKIGPMFKIFHKDLNYILQQVFIDGENITSLDQSNVLKDYLELIKLEKGIRNYYNASVKECGGHLITSVESNYLTIIDGFTKDIENILNFEEDYKNKILNLLKVKKFNRELNFYKRKTYEYLKSVMVSLNTIREFEGYENTLEEIKKNLNKYPEFKELCEKISELNLDYIKKYYGNIAYISKHSESLEELQQLRSRLKETCPKLTMSLESFRGGNLKEQYKDFQGAVKYAAFNSHIKTLLNIDVKTIEKSLYEETIRENQLVREIVAKKAWYNQIQRTTEAQKRSLFTWMEAIKRIGKGTGSQAVKYRKIAQSEMENCKDVIPVWIMPINRVIENLKLNENLFDVVIVDESSQSDVSALSVLMRAERAVIVGDEKQISPEAIGKNAEKVEELIDLHLKDIPHKQWFDLKTSLYNTALRVFPNRLVLKEHFRSLEDIIGFSNNLCYSKEIIPLRCSLNENALAPIKTVKIEEGFRDGNKPINIKEAYEIVETIKKCCEDPAYEGMNMGVISLLGEPQAELIENMLIEKIGIEEMVKRNLVCGDAYSFQGDERDIIFLTMVVGNNVKFAALSKDSDTRRFNVAASRAKNQMWLFHSVDPEELSPKCVRRELLCYMENYTVNKEIESEAAVTLLLSSFEEDLQEEFTKQGIALTPHFKIGKYTIDFIVNGEKKLALKCIGKNNHLPYSYEEEYAAQHTLERAGWKFLKVRSSEFYLNKEAVIAPLR
ncbi:AAA domain-containing protein [Clostridium sp.]|uniref:AAA domain-containing protein n=1 Tax=Clostridium sp. TaxID=1506 RepID=UPI002FCC546F